MIAALILCGVGLLPASPDVGFRGERYKMDELPEDISSATVLALEAWGTFALEHDYRIDLDKSGVCVFLTPKGGGVAREQMRLIDQTIFVFDKWLPQASREERLKLAQEFARAAQQAREAKKGKRKKKQSSRFKRKVRIPEDPEDLPFPWKGKTGEERYELQYRWGSGPFRPDASAVVFFALRNSADQASLLEELVRKESYLEEWAETAGQFNGFTLTKPLVGAYLLEAPDLEEWHPDAELVNRMARLLLMRRFGRQPYWLPHGLAFTMELALRDSVYCFPYRNEFVGVGEHEGWKRDLARRLAIRNTLTWAEVTDWGRGTYDDHKARLARGLIDFAIEEHPDVLSLALEHLRQRWEADARVEKRDGTWTLRPQFELTAETQGALLESHLGEAFLGRALESLKSP